MNEDLKSRWLDALRSGRYVMGAGVLEMRRNFDGTTSCCPLGVLVDTVDPKGWRKDKATDGHAEIECRDLLESYEHRFPSRRGAKR